MVEKHSMRSGLKLKSDLITKLFSIEIYDISLPYVSYVFVFIHKIYFDFDVHIGPAFENSIFWISVQSLEYHWS
jgi:hypothetical protein